MTDWETVERLAAELCHLAGGQPTPEYTTGTPYPIAHGWDCSGCQWKPEGTP